MKKEAKLIAEEILSEISQETRKGKIKWESAKKEDEREEDLEFGHMKATWEDKELMLSVGFDMGYLCYLTVYRLRISKGEKSSLIDGSVAFIVFFPLLQPCWKIARLLQKIYSSAKRKEELRLKEEKDSEEFKGLGNTNSSLG